jgi:hypothetical protein
MKLNALKFALAGGISISLMATLVTLSALLKWPGYVEFAQGLSKIYGAYGYSVTWTGVFVGAFWGFLEGFVHIGLIGWIYNKLV